MTEPIFVVSPTELYTGNDALSRLAMTNDREFMTPDGILRVSAERWQKAQDYERTTWMEHNRQRTEDRNEDHAEQFDQYRSLPRDLGTVIELGCGTFTNIRLIMQGRTANPVFLLDPLINTYLEHPNCAYKDGTLNGVPVELINSTIEDYNPRRRKFDTVIMVNVLKHCYDAESIFAKIPKLLKPGGHLVWCEYPTAELDEPLWDAGHPLKISVTRMETFLSQFKQVYRNGWYFIGQTE